MMRKLNNMNIEYIEILLLWCSDCDMKMNQGFLKTVHEFISASERL